MAANNKRIFILDDDESVCRALAVLLAAHGFSADTFTSAEDFFSTVSDADDGCLILDIHMPGVDGWEVLRRTVQFGSRRPVIIITADKHGASHERALQAGAVGFLQKPFDDEELLGLIQTALKKESREVHGIARADKIKITNKAGRKDFSAQARVKTALEASENRYRRLFEAAQDGILILDADTGIIKDVNPFLINMLGYRKTDILGKKLWEIGAFKDIKASQRAFLELQAKKYVRYEDLPLETKDGRRINVEFVSNVYLADHQRVIQCNIRDITDRKKAEEAVQRSLEEKEILLKELHHRVKNNLQIVMSLLQLKIIDAKNARVSAICKQMQERVKVMALVHQRLCEAKDFRNIDICGYVHELVDELLAAYGVDQNRISVKVDAAEMLLKIDAAVPCGMIINELLTNALKYAFPGERSGEIIIALRMANKGTVEIIVSDNGVGFKRGFILESSKTMGLDLVVSTIETQLGGRVKLSREGGARFEVTFKI